MLWFMSARKNYALNPSSDLEASASGQHSWVFAQIVALGPVKKKKKEGEKMFEIRSAPEGGRKGFTQAPFF